MCVYICRERERERERERVIAKKYGCNPNDEKDNLSFSRLSTNIQNEILQNQRSTYPGCHVAMMSKFFTVGPNICGSSVWTLLHGTILVPGNLSSLLDFLKMYATLV
jgi:hypothetical protein